MHTEQMGQAADAEMWPNGCTILSLKPWSAFTPIASFVDPRSSLRSARLSLTLTTVYSLAKQGPLQKNTMQALGRKGLAQVRPIWLDPLPASQSQRLKLGVLLCRRAAAWCGAMTPPLPALRELTR
jgi:hypothetical protein